MCVHSENQPEVVEAIGEFRFEYGAMCEHILYECDLKIFSSQSPLVEEIKRARSCCYAN